MPGHGKVDAEARIIADELTSHPNTRYTLTQLLDATGLPNNGSTGTAIRRAAKIIADSGMFLPVAMGTNVYGAMTRADDKVLAAYFNLAAQEVGVHERKVEHGVWVEAHKDDLDPIDKVIFERMKAHDDAMAEAHAAHAAEMAELRKDRLQLARTKKKMDKAARELVVLNAKFGLTV